MEPKGSHLEISKSSQGSINMDAWDGQDGLEELRSPISLGSPYLVYAVHSC